MVFSSPAASMQSSTFGSPSIFGQSHNPGNSPFPSKPFGSVTTFGAPTGGSIFGGTSTSTFGATSSSTSSTVFGSAMPAFTASSSSSFGGSSIFGQKPASGASSTTGFGFSSTPSFGQPTIPAVSSSFLGTTQSPFGTWSSPSGGQARIPTLGSTDFGQSVSGEKCGSKVSSYKRTVVDEGRLVSVSGMPVYNDKSHEELRWEDYHFADKGGSRVGTSSIHEKAFTPLTAYARSSANTSFSSTITPTFSFPVTKVSNTAFSSSPLGTSSSANSFAPTSGPNSSPSLFGPSSSPAFTSSPSIFNSTTPSSINPFSSSIPTFKPNSSPSLFGPSSSPAFTSSPSIFNSTTPSSINPFSSSVPTFGPNSSPSLFGPSSSPAFTSSPPIFNSTTPTSTNPFSSSISSNPFGPKGSVSLFGPSTSPAFSSSPSIFNSTTPASTNPFSSSIPSNPFGPIRNPFEPNSSVSLSSQSTSPAFLSSPSISSSTSAPKSAFVFEPNFFTSSPAVTSSPSILSSTEWGTKNTPSLFGPPANPGFCSGSSFDFTQSSPLFMSIAPSSSASFLMSKPNTIISPSTGSVFESNLFSCTPSHISMSTVFPPGQTTPFFSTLFQPGQTAQTQTRGSSGDGGVDGGIGQSTAAQEFVTQSTAEVKLPSVLSPFGTLPAMPQPSIALQGSTPSLKYGISSIPVSDKQAPVRVSSSLTIQHLSQRRNRLPVQKYNPKSIGRKVPFFSDELPTPAFIPRENPRALVICPSERWPLRVNSEKISALKCSSIHASNENSQEDAEEYAPVLDGAIYQDENGNSGENSTAKSCATESATATAYANLTALLPKLHKCSDYYTEPQIQELASKERAEPGSISRVQDFIIGRHGYGSIKFLGLIDARQLDLESLIQFTSREVIVYPDESKKHPVGQGLNKPAEVTLLNIKYIDKRTGKHYVDGPKADKYREMLIKKAADQGAEFVSYDPVVGEWKFRVLNFN